MCSWCGRLAGFVLLLLTVPAKAAEGGGQPIVLVADSRLFSGALAWWANVYNESRWEFTLLTIVVIPLLGLLMGKASAIVLSGMGVNLKSRVLAER